MRQTNLGGFIDRLHKAEQRRNRIRGFFGCITLILFAFGFVAACTWIVRAIWDAS